MLNRTPAIEAWWGRLKEKGHAVAVMDRDAINRANVFFPTVGQAKLLLAHGCKDALTRILTLIGVIEGFGNDGIRLLPEMDFSEHFVESLDGTCIAHLHRGLMPRESTARTCPIGNDHKQGCHLSDRRRGAGEPPM